MKLSLNTYLKGALNVAIEDVRQRCQEHLQHDGEIADGYLNVIAEIQRHLTFLAQNSAQYSYVASLIFDLHLFWQQCLNYCNTYPLVYKLISTKDLCVHADNLMERYANRLFVAYDKFIACLDKTCIMFGIDIDTVNPVCQAYWPRDQRMEQLTALFSDKVQMKQIYTRLGVSISALQVIDSDEYIYDAEKVDQIFDLCTSGQPLARTISKTQFVECVKYANFSSIGKSASRMCKFKYMIHILHHAIVPPYAQQWQRQAAASIGVTPSQLTNNKSNLDAAWVGKLHRVFQEH